MPRNIEDILNQVLAEKPENPFAMIVRAHPTAIRPVAALERSV